LAVLAVPGAGALPLGECCRLLLAGARWRLVLAGEPGGRCPAAQAHGGEPIIPFSGAYESKIFDMGAEEKEEYNKENSGWLGRCRAGLGWGCWGCFGCGRARAGWAGLVLGCWHSSAPALVRSPRAA
jgi:hypothetical protein